MHRFRAPLLLLLAAGCGGGGGARAVDPNPGVLPTTVDARIVLEEAGGPIALREGPGEPHEVRALPGVPEPSADARGRARSFAYWWVFADPQIIDEESPARLQFFDSITVLGGLLSPAYRPQEDLSTQLLNAAVLTANELMRDYGRDFDLALCVGDDADNGELAEVRWFAEVLDGAATVRPDTGELDLVGGRNRGARNFGAQAPFDPYERPGYPDSNADFAAPGLRTPLGERTPWYSAIGNHDQYHMGIFPVDDGREGALLNDFFYGADQWLADRQPFGFLLGLPTLVLDTIDCPKPGSGCAPPPRAFYNLIGGETFGELLGGLFSDPAVVEALLRIPDFSPGREAVEAEENPNFDFSQIVPEPYVPGTSRFGVPVEPDPSRAFVGAPGFIAEMRARGRGYAPLEGACNAFLAGYPGVPDGTDPEKGFFVLDAADARGGAVPVRLVFLNTGEGSQVSEGIMTDAQFRWLGCELGRAEADGRLVVLLSHHQEANVSRITDPELRARPGEPYCGDPKLCEARIEALLHGRPNVVLHLVGHGHENKITPHPFVPGPGEPDAPERGYWEIETSSLIDWPQQSRVVELVAYPDGVGEIWTTVVDHRPLSADPDLNVLSELGRELAANDPQRRLPPGADALVQGEGTPEDRNRVLRFKIPPGPLARLFPDASVRPGDGTITSRDRFGGP